MAPKRKCILRKGLLAGAHGREEDLRFCGDCLSSLYGPPVCFVLSRSPLNKAPPAAPCGGKFSLGPSAEAAFVGWLPGPHVPGAHCASEGTQTREHAKNQRQRSKEQFAPALTRRRKTGEPRRRREVTGGASIEERTFQCGKRLCFFTPEIKAFQSSPTPGDNPKRGPQSPFWSLKRGIFKGEMNRNISPLNGALPTLPLLAKWVAPGGETLPKDMKKRKKRGQP